MFNVNKGKTGMSTEQLEEIVGEIMSGEYYQLPVGEKLTKEDVLRIINN